MLRVAALRASSPSVAGWSSGVALFAVIAALTEGISARAISLGLFAASAARVAAGEVWLLLSSALIVDRPVAVGLIAFALIAFATLWVCGARTFWIAAVAGHVGSTLIVYGIIGIARLADPHAFASAVARPDFGVSAMQGAWVGALTAHIWKRAGTGLRPRALTLAGVCALTGVAWALHPDPSILTVEHVFAFLIGAALVGRPASVSWLARAGAAARSAPASFGYLFILSATTAWLTTENGRDVDAMLLSRSTNLDNLAHDPVRVVVASAFWLSSSWRPLAVTAVLLVGVVAPLERRIGSRRTVVVLAAGHVGATLSTAVGLWAAVRLGAIEPAIAHARDVGPSYAIYAAAAALTYVLVPSRRLPYLGALVVWVAVPGLLSMSFTDVGHGFSVAIGLACYRVVRAASQVGRAGFDPHLLRQERRALPLELPALAHIEPPRAPGRQAQSPRQRRSA